MWPVEWLIDLKMKQETKMTREEAEKIVATKGYSIGTDSLFAGRGLPPEKEFLNTLEALGLIKFDEPEFLTINRVPGLNTSSVATIAIKDMVTALQNTGYCVYKKSI